MIEPATMEAAIRERAKTRNLAWSVSTIDSIRNHLVSTLKDFGLLQGARRRRMVRPRPGEQTTLFAARLSRHEGLTDRQILDARWFQLLGLDRKQVADRLYAAHRAGILGFRMQADVVELDLPLLEEEG